MPASFILNLIFPQGPQIIRYGWDVIARVMATRTYAWVRSIVVEAVIELLERAHGFMVEWSARCVKFIALLFLLTFSSANAQTVHFMNEFCDAFRRADWPRLKYTALRVVLLAGEVFLLHVGIALLLEAVSFFFLAWSWLNGVAHSESS
jgi:hypothetical protein